MCVPQTSEKPSAKGARSSMKTALIPVRRAAGGVRDNPFAPAELGDAVLAAQAIQYDTDLVLGRKMPPGRPANVLHDLFRRRSHRHGFLSHLRSLQGLR